MSLKYNLSLLKTSNMIRAFFNSIAYDENDSDFLQFMSNNHPNHVWTRIDGADGYIYNINGWHIVDRIDYVITEVPWLDYHNYEVLDYMPYQ